MFTGLIEATAQIINRTDHDLTIERPKIFNDIRIGSSICVSGACLSITELTDHSMRFDVHEETWSRTKLGSLSKGDHVNFERALKADGRFEGHIVQGHVDAVGIVAIRHQESGIRMTVDYPAHLRGHIVEKGSITIDGVSLTVASVDHDHFTVALIPLTLEGTTLSEIKEGDRVNLETDVLAKYVRG